MIGTRTSCSSGDRNSRGFLVLVLVLGSPAAHAMQVAVPNPITLPVTPPRSLATPVTQPTIEIPPLLPTETDAQEHVAPAHLHALVLQLDDARWEVREQAMVLMRDAAPGILDICALLAGDSGDDLSPESRYRLLDLLQELLIRRPRAALGIRMNSQTVPGAPFAGVEITMLIDALPAREVLSVGDRITHIDGLQLHSSTDLIITVQSHHPGDDIMLRVLRPVLDEAGEQVSATDGQPMFNPLDLVITLGSVERLSDPESGLPPPRDNALTIRRRVEWEEACRRWLPHPAAIPFRGPVPDDLLFDQETLVMPPVDEHPIIMELLVDLAMIDYGKDQMTDDHRARWNIRYQMLLIDLNRPGLGSVERSYLRQVLDRHHELVNNPGRARPRQP